MRIDVLSKSLGAGHAGEEQRQNDQEHKGQYKPDFHRIVLLPPKFPESVAALLSMNVEFRSFLQTFAGTMRRGTQEFTPALQ